MGRFERGLAKLSPNSTATRSLAASHLPDTAAPAPEHPICFFLADGSGVPCDGSCSWCHDYEPIDLDELVTMDGLR